MFKYAKALASLASIWGSPYKSFFLTTHRFSSAVKRET
jgi:hypothetical protein